MSAKRVVIVGGGIVGLATGFQLVRLCPDTHVTILEKESALAFHQTGRNSGVLHSGIYYKPGSLRALNCRAGKLAMEEFCAAEGIAYEICGKVIVALNDRDVAGLQRIFERGQANGVKCEMISKERLNELEPHTAGIQAIHVPEAGIVDYVGVCKRLAEKIVAAGGVIQLNARVTGVAHSPGEVVVRSTAGELTADVVVNCAGLYSDKVATMTGVRPESRVIPFRGEYFEVKPSAAHLCRNLIYPTPDPAFPFLGVHFTRMVLGGVECGPNAVLAFAREGYHLTDVNFREFCETLGFVGFRRMAWKHWRMGLDEMWRSFSKAAFVRALQRLIPEIRAEDLETAPAGVRAQALSPDGSLVDDFLILEAERVVNVCNAPSPAATASLNVGKLIVERVARQLGYPAPGAELTAPGR